MDTLLTFYFEYILKWSSRLPVPMCYKILLKTGHWFRNWKTYSAANGFPGILYHAEENLKTLLNISPTMAKNILHQFLAFESRYILENNWIKTKNEKNIKNAFNQAAIEQLKIHLQNRQAIICTMHSANLCLVGALLHIIGHHITFMLAIIPEAIPNGANPLHQNGIRMIMEWKEWQSLVPANMQAARQALSNGASLILASDTPGYNQKGVLVTLFGQRFWVPVGAAKLAQEFQLPLFVAIPWAKDVTSRYDLVIQEIDTSGTLQDVMARVFQVAEQAILKNPSCWMGWLGLHLMADVSE